MLWKWLLLGRQRGLLGVLVLRKLLVSFFAMGLYWKGRWKGRIEIGIVREYRWDLERKNYIRVCESACFDCRCELAIQGLWSSCRVTV